MKLKLSSCKRPLELASSFQKARITQKKFEFSEFSTFLTSPRKRRPLKDLKLEELFLFDNVIFTFSSCFSSVGIFLLLLTFWAFNSLGDRFFEIFLPLSLLYDEFSLDGFCFPQQWEVLIIGLKLQDGNGDDLTLGIL